VAEVGFVGLGAMGSGMVRRLLAAGHAVHGWNRTREKAAPLVEAGMELRDSPREVAERADAVLTMVTNTKALEAVTSGPDGILAGLGLGKVYVDMSTVMPAASRDLAARVRELGAEMLDAPVSGSLSTLEEGKLSIMVDGDEATLEQVRPVLEAIGPKVTRVGGNGQAVLMKIAT
jgi:3-hydroxyisobutyrate dehydrogenase-like beta-hydroxyacid dehydrogenase